MLDITFAKPALPKAGALVLPLMEAAPLSGMAALLDTAMEGGLTRALEAASFKGKSGQSVTLWGPHAGITKLVVMGLGAVDKADAEKCGGNLVPMVSGEAQVTVAADGLDGAALAMGAALRHYRFDRYRTMEKPEDKPKLAMLTIATGAATAAKAAFVPMKAVVEGVFFARDLVSEPANILTPVEFAERLKGLEKLGLSVDTLGPKEMKKLGFGALLGVAQGSINEPRMVVMRWNGSGKKKMEKPLCFIGKGVTFDTGGVSIKPAGGMEDMKWDMAGAGTVAPAKWKMPKI